MILCCKINYKKYCYFKTPLSVKYCIINTITNNKDSRIRKKN